MKLLWKLFMAAMAIVGIVTVVVCWLGGGICPPAHSRTAAISVKPAIQQLVVWHEKEPGQPAHYVSGSYGGIYTTACGQTFSGPSVHAKTIERMEAEKRIPCGDCIRALNRYTESMAARKRTDMPK